MENSVNAKKCYGENIRRSQAGLIAFCFWALSTGEPAINTADALAMRTVAFGCGDQHGAGLIADRQPSLTVPTGAGSYFFFRSRSLITHYSPETIHSSSSRYP